MSRQEEKEEKVLTPEEIQGDGFGHTAWEQPERENDLNKTVSDGKTVYHEWTQYGNEAICSGKGHVKHGMMLHPMEMIIKDEEGYKIVPVPQLS